MTKDIDVSGGWELNRREGYFTFSDEEVDLLRDNGYFNSLRNQGYDFFSKGLITARMDIDPIPEDNQYIICDGNNRNRNVTRDPRFLNDVTSILGPGRIV